MQDRRTANMSMAPHPVDNVHPVAPDSIQSAEGTVYATEPLGEFAAKVLDCLELRLTAPQVLPAVARHDLAAHCIAQKTRWMQTRDLTLSENGELRRAKNELRRSRKILANAGRLDLIGGA